MSNFEPFVMERMMSKYENAVEFNLSESGVHAMTLGELLELGECSVDSLLATEIDYAQANGELPLRENIARLYDGATVDNVLVTVGAAEANYLTIHTLIEPGDEVVFMRPNYMQVWGNAHNRGARIKDFHLREENNWAPDLAELEEVVSDDTKLIAICNPNNPTGRIMTEAEMDAIVAQAARVGAWILADEVYTGAERVREEETPSFYGRYDKVIASGSMSKAYGLPGLRLGWAVGPAQTLDDMWARHEYTTISSTAISNRLAALALSSEVRPKILERTRGYIRRGFPVLQEWAKSLNGKLRVFPGDAAAIAFARYDLELNSTTLVEQLRDELSVLIVPGDHFGIDHCLRISFGLPHDYLKKGLDRISAGILA
jgi:aspartate/methionine/tyrosine aminotransferase